MSAGRTMARWSLALVVALVSLTAPPRARAESDGIVIHKVSPGDSLELLAAEYYGDRQHKIYIMIENGLDHPRPLKKGERLRIPVSQEVTTAVGDTLDSLAERYLGDKRRSRFLAEFNGLDPDSTLAAGMSLSVPLRVTYKAAAPASLRAIALALFADGKKAQLLKAYNFLTSDDLAAGEAITVPIYLRVQPSKRRPPDADSSERVETRVRLTEEAQRAVPLARAAWIRGDFETVKRQLAEFVPNFSYLDAEQVAAIGILLGSAYVAFDDVVTARTTFSEVLGRLPKQTLSTYEYSPKILAVWQQAGGDIDDSQP